jgi:hypothetical protein
MARIDERVADSFRRRLAAGEKPAGDEDLAIPEHDVEDAYRPIGAGYIQHGDGSNLLAGAAEDRVAGLEFAGRHVMKVVVLR